LHLQPIQNQDCNYALGSAGKSWKAASDLVLNIVKLFVMATYMLKLMLEPNVTINVHRLPLPRKITGSTSVMLVLQEDAGQGRPRDCSSKSTAPHLDPIMESMQK